MKKCIDVLMILALLFSSFAWMTGTSEARDFEGVETQAQFQAAEQKEVLADSVPPSTITSLEARTGDPPGSVELRWIAPGDDYSTGTAAAYVIRYNTKPIVIDEYDNTWITSIDVENEPSPNPAGSLESMTVTGLEAGRKYYFALRSEDEVSNTSSVSNLAQATSKNNPNALYLPIIAYGTYTDTVIIPDTTVVLPITTTQYLEKLSDEGTFTFDHWTPELEALDPGDVLVGDVSDKAPNGFLRKVKSVDVLCDKVVVTTELATLEEAIQTASIHASQELTPVQVMSVQNAKGVTMASSPDGLGFELKLEDVVLYDHDKNFLTKSDQITAEGSLSLDLGADVGIDIAWFQLKQFRFIVNATETSEISVNWGYSKSIEKSIPVNLSYLKFTPFTIMAGPVPVVIQPEISLDIDFEGNVTAVVTAGVRQEATLRLGVTYENGYWSGVHEFSNKFEFNSPSIEVSGSVMLGFNPKLILKLYGVVGPYAGAIPYVKAEATGSIPIADNQDVTLSTGAKLATLSPGGMQVPSAPNELEISLYAGLKLQYGAKADLLGRELVDYEGPLLNFQFLLLRFTFFDNREPNAPSDPIPTDNTSDQPLNPLLLWTGGDPDDGDIVTYDLYLEANESYPDELVYHGSNTSFDPPGILSPNTDYFWRVLAKDSEGATNTGPTWSFRTGASVNDPPNEPSLPTPGDGTMNTLIYLDLSWTGGDLNGDGITYDVYLDTSSPPVKLLAEDIEETNVYTGGLQLITPYFWKVVAQDEHGRTTSGDVWSFTTGTSPNRPPTEPVNLNDGETNVPLLDIVSWSLPPDTIPDPDEDWVTYTVYLEAEDITPDEQLCVLQWDWYKPYDQFFCETGQLQGNTGYYWQVVARDDHGATTTGPVWMFTTADMIYVPAGEFQMGCDVCNPDEICSPEEEPLHTVFLNEFTINRTEITNAEYAECVSAERCNPPYSLSSRTYPDYYTNTLYADYPVLYINHGMANDYCQGIYNNGSLPTEAQWEKAARGGLMIPSELEPAYVENPLPNRKYPWGNADPDCTLLNYSPEGASSCVGDTSLVGSYPLGASPYGTVDMSGNVQEWVRDVYSSTYYSNSPNRNPLGPSEGDTFVVRGGSWESDDYGVRLARRWYAYIEEGNDTLGFRCAVYNCDGWGVTDYPWTGSGSGTTTVVSDGYSEPAQFTYDNPGSYNGSWEFKTMAASAGTHNLDWVFSGFHSWYQVTVSLEAFVEHEGTVTTINLVDEGPVNCCDPPSGGFTYSGTHTFSVEQGDEYGFRMAGSHSDSAQQMYGTLTVTESNATCSTEPMRSATAR